MSAAPPRLTFIDALKAVASQLIVLHHLAFYGPLSDKAQALAPELVAWLSDHARIAVQAFLVLGGFLAARGLAPRGELTAENPLALAWRRYLKLAPPYVAALVLAIGASALAGVWMSHRSISAAPTLPQFLAHVLLLQDILGYEALSAGVWYIAIDLQLFALLLALLWLARRTGAPGTLGPLLVLGLVLASLFHFNRDSAWDAWALYFFGAYGMGALAWWASETRRGPVWLGAIAAVALAALAAEFRLRIAVALAVALMLGVASRTGTLGRWPRWRPVAFLGRISYSVFLVHFPVCLVVNAAFSRFAADDPVVSAGGMLVAWLASGAAGAALHRFVESRAFGVFVAIPAPAPASRED